MSEAMLFNGRQGIVLDDIARFWKGTKRADSLTPAMPCIFFVDIRGVSFHVTYESGQKGESLRDVEFMSLARAL